VFSSRQVLALQGRRRPAQSRRGGVAESPQHAMRDRRAGFEIIEIRVTSRLRQAASGERLRGCQRATEFGAGRPQGRQVTFYAKTRLRHRDLSGYCSHAGRAGARRGRPASITSLNQGLFAWAGVLCERGRPYTETSRKRWLAAV